MRRNIIILISVVAFSLAVTGCSRENLEDQVRLELPEEELEIVCSEDGADELVGIDCRQRGEWKGFSVYLDNGYFKNHFIPSGWMGDFGDLKYNQNWQEDVYSRASCIKIEYTAEALQGNKWAGMYWQNPENNWGMKESGGYNLKDATKLTFQARGNTGSEIIREFKMGGITGAYPDSDTASIGPLALTNEWKEYTIDLTGMDLSYIIGGFAWVASALDNPDGMVFYLDDIQYE